MKQFAETGRSDLLEEQTQGEGGIYDEFNAPPIPKGSGRTEAEFFVDGNHSFVSKINIIKFENLPSSLFKIVNVSYVQLRLQLFYISDKMVE